MKKSAAAGDGKEKMGAAADKTRGASTPSGQKGKPRGPNAGFRKQVKQRQNLGLPGKRRQTDLVSSSARGLLGQQHQTQPLTMAANKRHRLTPFPPHPSKLPGAPLYQRRQRRTTSVAATPDTTCASLHKVPANQVQQQLGKQCPPGLEYICSGCQQPIKDRFLLSACDKYWHDNCLKCNRCQAKLGELGSSLYEAANMNLCRQDYFEMFGQKAICAVCDKLIYATEMVMRARENVYHLECFACQLCGLRFCVGDRFHLCENKIVCQYDFDEHIYPIQCQQEQQHYGLQFDMAAANNNSAPSQVSSEAPELGRAQDHQHQHNWAVLDTQAHSSPSGPTGGEQQHHPDETASCNSGAVYQRLESGCDSLPPKGPDQGPLPGAAGMQTVECRELAAELPENSAAARDETPSQQAPVASARAEAKADADENVTEREPNAMGHTGIVKTEALDCIG